MSASASAMATHASSLKHSMSHESPQTQQPGAPSDVTLGSPERSEKRRKVTRACDSCKGRKRRCNGQLPCQSCQNNGVNCTYLASYTRGRLHQPSPAAHTATHPGANNAFISPTQQEVFCNVSLLVAKGDETGARTSRATSPEGGSMTFAGQYLGPTSPYTFLRRAWRRFEKDGIQSNLTGNTTEEVNQSEPIWAFGDRQVSPVAPDGFQL